MTKINCFASNFKLTGKLHEMHKLDNGFALGIFENSCESSFEAELSRTDGKLFETK